MAVTFSKYRFTSLCSTLISVASTGVAVELLESGEASGVAEARSVPPYEQPLQPAVPTND